MKLIQKIAACVAIACVGPLAQAAVLTYDYSYQFTNGESITGTFTGEQAGGLVSNIGNVTGQIAPGGPDAGYVFHDLMPGSYNSSTGISHTGAVVSLTGINNNFFFTNATDTNWFYIFTPVNSQSLEQAKMDGERFIDYDNRYYNASNFRVAAEAGNDPGTVPEPASIALLGLGLVGCFAARRRSK